MSTIPTLLDHDLALHLCETAGLSDHEIVICSLIAIAACLGEPVDPDLLAEFRQILGRTAAS